MEEPKIISISGSKITLSLIFSLVGILTFLAGIETIHALDNDSPNVSELAEDIYHLFEEEPKQQITFLLKMEDTVANVSYGYKSSPQQKGYTLQKEGPIGDRWSHSSTYPDQVPPVAMAARVNGNGRITCKIKRGFHVVAENTAEGVNATVQCDYDPNKHMPLM